MTVTKPATPVNKPTAPQQTNWNASQKTDTQHNRVYFKEVTPSGETLTWNVKDIPTFNPFN